MVYFTLKVVLGVVLTKDELKMIIGEQFFDENYCYDFNDFKIDGLPKKIELFRFPCCSDSAKKLFILGHTMHTYYRKYIRCDQCPEYCVCDTCIGNTNNGYYNVREILSNPTEVNIRNVCLYCYSDNKLDLGGPITTCTIINDRFQKPISEDLRIKCSTCNNLPNEFRCPSDFLKWCNHNCSQISKFLNNYKINKEVKLYYSLDDCLSCT